MSAAYFEGFEPVMPVMPEEYRGRSTKQGDYTLTAPREWTEEEVAWMLQLRADGYTQEMIARSMGRSLVSVRVKMKRLAKEDNTYNAAHVADKYAVNEAFCAKVQPKSVLDAYCGVRRWWSDKASCVTNDKNAEIEADYHLDAYKLLCKLYAEGNSFDVVDLDPFGSAYDCLDLAVKMARKGLVVTLGELGHKRFGRLDYVGSHYGIESMEEFDMGHMVEHIRQIGRRNKRNLVVFAEREWRNIGRVWFLVEPLKVTEQWKKNNGEVNV